MYSLLYCQDIKEYYICKSKNVIQEEDGVCLVAFRAKLVLGGCASKHNLQRIQKSLLEDPFLYVQEADPNEEVADYSVSTDLVTENTNHDEIIEDNKRDVFAEVDRDTNMNEEETSFNYNELTDLFTTKQYVIRSGISEDIKTTANKTENEVQKMEITKLNTVPESELQEKTYICCFCKLKHKNFVKHMITFHKNEEEVKKLVTLPKNSPEREKCLKKMKMKATNYFKLLDEINKRHHLEERHTRNRSIIKPSRCLKLVIGSKLISHKHKTIYSDDMFVLFGNRQCDKFNGNTQIRTQLQVLANIFNKLLKNNSEMSDLGSVFHPENIQTFLNLQDKPLRNYEIRYLIKFGTFLVQLYTSKREFQKKIDTEEAIKLLYKTLKGKSVKNELPKKQLHLPLNVEKKLPKKQLHLPIILDVKEVKKEIETNTTNQEKRQKERIPHLPIKIKSEKIPKNETEQSDDDTQKKAYPLRQKARNCQRMFLEAQLNNEVSLDLIDEEEKPEDHTTSTYLELNNKRYLFCFYCEKLYATQIIQHLERMHSDEEDVQKFCSFPKGSAPRKRLITKICLKGKYKYETTKLNRDINDLIKHKKHQHIKKNNRKSEENHNDETTETNVTKKKERHRVQQNNCNKNECEENYSENEETVLDAQNISINNQKEELDVQDIGINNETTGDESADVEEQRKELEEYFEITTHENKLEFKEDDTKESLMCMLAEHVNCSPTC